MEFEDLIEDTYGAIYRNDVELFKLKERKFNDAS